MKHILFTILLLLVIACKKENIKPNKQSINSVSTTYFLEADVNGKHIKYTSPTVRIDSDTYINSGNTSDTVIAIIIPYTTVGTYPLTTSSSQEGICLIPNKNFTGTESGSITISSINSTIIEGTFYFTQYNPSNGHRVEIINGIFKILIH